MRRPPLASVVAIRSMAWAICGSARWTAGATLASSALMMVAISREDLRSRSAEAALDFSVVRRWRSVALRFTRLSPLRLSVAAREKQVLRFAQDDRLKRLIGKQVLRFAQDDNLYLRPRQQVLPIRQAQGQDDNS